MSRRPPVTILCLKKLCSHAGFRELTLFLSSVQPCVCPLPPCLAPWEVCPCEAHWGSLNPHLLQLHCPRVGQRTTETLRYATQGPMQAQRGWKSLLGLTCCLGLSDGLTLVLVVFMIATSYPTVQATHLVPFWPSLYEHLVFLPLGVLPRVLV